MSKTIAIVVPVLDDWKSLAALTADIADRFACSGIAMHLCIVDDGSATPLDADAIAFPSGAAIRSAEVIRLALNLGHQRAVAVGLSVLAERGDLDAVVVMDGDGEDRPADLAVLLAAAERHPNHAVLAARTKRSEPLSFRLWYRLYKLLFYLLTGQGISFGNFCLLPFAAVRRLVHMPELWNNLPASIMRSRLPYVTVPTVRGVRTDGRSRMNLVSLIVHGLSALSVHTDMIFVRVLLAAAAVGAAAVLGIAAVIAVRFGTDIAIPGWATTAAGDLLIILLQILVVVVAATLTMLAGRSNRPIVPIADSGVFIARRERYQRETKPLQAAVLHQ